MRTFVAIEIDHGVKERIEQLRDRLELCDPDVKWVKSEQIHLTIKFMGEVDEASTDEIAWTIAEAVREMAPFEIDISDVGTFPKRRPTVLWVGVGDKAGSLEKLHRVVDKALARLGIEEEKRRFTAHITLGRIRSGRNLRKLLDILQEQAGQDFGRVKVESLTLFVSKLTPDGPKHTRLATAVLGKLDPEETDHKQCDP